MDSGEKITGEILTTIAGQLIETLQAIHRVGIIHRDVKPTNIIYDEASESIKLIDFGCADAFDQSLFKGSAGTELYKSEAFTNQPAEDWYALSLTLTELSDCCNNRRAVKRVLELCERMRRGINPISEKVKKGEIENG